MTEYSSREYILTHNHGGKALTEEEKTGEEKTKVDSAEVDQPKVDPAIQGIDGPWQAHLPSPSCKDNG